MLEDGSAKIGFTESKYLFQTNSTNTRKIPKGVALVLLSLTLKGYFSNRAEWWIVIAISPIKQ